MDREVAYFCEQFLNYAPKTLDFLGKKGVYLANYRRY